MGQLKASQFIQFIAQLSTENYRLQSKYENHLIAKVALFQFVNSFLSLFYIAFYLRDQDKLKEVSVWQADRNFKPNFRTSKNKLPFPFWPKLILLV